jgi:hypothetical protein
MNARLCIFCLALACARPAAAVEESSTPAQDNAHAGAAKSQASPKRPGEHLTQIERRRAELENKLKVEQVLLKGVGEKGVEIEISYRIVDADGYAAHPKTTFIADEGSRNIVPLRKLQKLFKPLPAAEAEKLPPAHLTIWDKGGVIKPGQPVTVVVAGYGQKHLIPVASPDFDPEAVVTHKTRARSALAEPDAELNVLEVKVVGQGHLIKVRYKNKGIKKLDTADDWTYIEDPETGTRLPIAKVPRLGALAERDIQGIAESFMIMDNAGERIKPGQHVTVVVSGVRAENIPVVGE